MSYNKLYYLIKDDDEYNCLSINVDILDDVSYNFEIDLTSDIEQTRNDIREFIDNLQVNDYVLQSFNDSNNSSCGIGYDKDQIIFSTISNNGKIWRETNFKVKYDKNKLINILGEIYNQIIDTKYDYK